METRYCQHCGAAIKRKAVHSDAIYVRMLYCSARCGSAATNKRKRETGFLQLDGANPIERFAKHNGYTIEQAAKLLQGGRRANS